jgi:predicted amidohydrolase
MAAPLILAAAQTVSRPGDVGVNLERHVRLAETAAREGARLVLFPELSLTGYELDRAESLAFSEEDRRLDPLRDVAAARDLTVVAGAPVRLGAHLYVGAFVLSPSRSVRLYTKHHLGAFPPAAGGDGDVPAAEATVFSPGDRNPPIRIGHHTAAVAVCADAGRPSHSRAAAESGATVYLASMFVIPSERAAEEDNLRAIATGHSLTVVFANHGGPTGGLAAAGRSAIWSPAGELLARLDGPGAGVVLAGETDAGWSARTIALDPSGS